jgi:hypothetical protein
VSTSHHLLLQHWWLRYWTRFARLRSSSCADVQDRVFGLLAVRDSEAHTGLSVDYNLTPADLFRQLVSGECLQSVENGRSYYNFLELSPRDLLVSRPYTVHIAAAVSSLRELLLPFVKHSAHEDQPAFMEDHGTQFENWRRPGCMSCKKAFVVSSFSHQQFDADTNPSGLWSGELRRLGRQEFCRNISAEQND